VAVAALVSAFRPVLTKLAIKEQLADNPSAISQANKSLRVDAEKKKELDAALISLAKDIRQASSLKEAKFNFRVWTSNEFSAIKPSQVENLSRLRPLSSSCHVFLEKYREERDPFLA
jgi:hypothetical protein